VSERRTVRCAIYTRKSTEEGLEQNFNSLQAQREAGEAYIRSQQQSGWVALEREYDDGGCSGANLERPALQRLLDDVAAGRVDAVVVYKVDRLSRSLFDFARLMGVFEQRGVSFVSVTQDFNTSTSMGRLTLNVLLSFAQFERELIRERTRDKLGAARRKGKWIGGIPILGYDVAPGGGRLMVNEVEAEQVRQIFAIAAAGESLDAIGEEIARRGIKTKQWTTHGAPAGPFCRPSPRGFECTEPTGGRPLLPCQSGRQKPGFGLHLAAIGTHEQLLAANWAGMAGDAKRPFRAGFGDIYAQGAQRAAVATLHLRPYRKHQDRSQVGQEGSAPVGLRPYPEMILTGRWALWT
jgi:DNA invertase Pin-like site-specific DNA recombinase